MKDTKVQFDPKELRSLERAFELGPKIMKKEIRKSMRAQAKPVTAKIRAEELSGTGTHSLGKGPGIRTDRGFYGMKRQHTKIGLKHKIKFGKGNRFGGYVRWGWGPRKPKSPGYVAFFHEFGTRNLPARGMVQHAAQMQMPGIDKAIERGIDKGLEKMWKQ